MFDVLFLDICSRIHLYFKISLLLLCIVQVYLAIPGGWQLDDSSAAFYPCGRERAPVGLSAAPSCGIFMHFFILKKTFQGQGEAKFDL